jgi:hypothetical protein
MMMTATTLTVATAHTFVVLTVSHGCYSADPSFAAARIPPIFFTESDTPSPECSHAPDCSPPRLFAASVVIGTDRIDTNRIGIHRAGFELREIALI